MKLRYYLLLIASLPTFFTSTAFATKAKLQALQGARFLTDSQLIFQNPGQIMRLGNYVTYELGGSTATATPKSEGGIFKEMFGGRGGVYIGHMSADQILFRSANGFLVEQNPVEFFWGKDNWAVSLGYSNDDQKTVAQKQQSLVARFGIDNEVNELWVNLEFIQSADNANDEYKGAPLLTVGGELHMENDLYLNGQIKYGQIENTITNVSTDTDYLAAEVGLLDRSIKTENAEIYWGPKLRYGETKIGGQKVTSYDLPLYIGMEYQGFSWFTARASVSQNLIIGQTKDETATPAPANEADTIGNNTTVATGIGINWKGLQIDATFAGSTTGQFNGTNILGNLALIYNF